MARQGKIVSFDDAKRVGTARSERLRDFDALPERSPAVAHRTREHRGSGASANRRYADVRSSNMPGRGDARYNRTGYGSLQTAARSGFGDTQAQASMRNPRKRKTGYSRYVNADEAYADFSDQQRYHAHRGGQEEIHGDGIPKDQNAERSDAAARKQRRKKARADKLFDKQFGGSDGPSDDALPRAAVYKTQMGPQQRKATRMQNASSAAPSSAGGFSLSAAASSLASVFSSKRMIIAAAIVALIIAALAFLYTPAQQYYQSVRENARLQVEYDAIQQRNASLQAANDTLGTDAGVETALHERYGYVKEGEETANVSGLSAEASKNNSADKVEGNIQDDSIKAPDTWYSGVLDVVFGYDK